MSEHEIVGRRADSNERITDVAVINSVDDVWALLNAGDVSYFTTTKDGKQAKVYARTSTAGRKYLTTNPDDTRENNLDFLAKV